MNNSRQLTVKPRTGNYLFQSFVKKKKNKRTSFSLSRGSGRGILKSHYAIPFSVGGNDGIVTVVILAWLIF
jgi:hypothetical protein